MKIIILLLLLINISGFADNYSGIGGSIGFSTFKLPDYYEDDYLSATSANICFTSSEGGNFIIIKEINFGWIFNANLLNNEKVTSIIQNYPVAITLNFLLGLGFQFYINRTLSCELGIGVNSYSNVISGPGSNEIGYVDSDIGLSGICAIHYLLSEKTRLRIGMVCAYNTYNIYEILGTCSNYGFENALYIYPSIVLMQRIIK
ncbi:MAG: hypothetical protein JXR64_12995 [Spirochaetales bacterium]|nr:hypothetical protein [Spirochaetales bacterium]